MVPQAAGVRRAGARVAAGVASVIALLLFAWWSSPLPAASALRAHRAHFAGLTRTPAPALGPRLERWAIRTSRGDTLRALFRAARPGAPAVSAEPPWAVVLLGGLDTGDHAALLLPDSLPVDVLALDWPWRGPSRMSAWEFARRLPAILDALDRAPSALALGVEALRRERGGVRVALLGASLGTPVAAAALGLTKADALVLVDGMADLRVVFESELRHMLGPGWMAAAIAPPLAALAARLTRALEPARHATEARALPVLLLDAENGSRYPAAAVRALHRSYPHATRARHPGGHMRPRRTEQMQAIVRQVGAWLDALPAADQGDAAWVPPRGERPRVASVERGVHR